MIRVLLADGHQLLHPGISTVLSATNEIVLVDSVTCDNQLRQLCYKHRPDIVLLALNITDPPCKDVLEYIQQQCPATKTLVLLDSPDEACVQHLVALGAIGGILKSDAPAKLVEAIQTVVAGQNWFSTALLSQLLQPGSGDQRKELTEREIEVLAEKSDKEISLALGITKRTVRFHLKHSNLRLGTTTRVGAVVEAMRRGFIQ